MLPRANNKTQKLQSEFSTDSLHHALIFQGNLIQQIESTQKMRIRLRNDIIGVIDENDQGEPRRYSP